ncbi:hypothetical protein LY78DRAFT_183184 [Colletotrichum sublineola]|nr:hypothetical protein LY78DRAFT_183184 [Colletotrichum sublineola]
MPGRRSGGKSGPILCPMSTVRRPRPDRWRETWSDGAVYGAPNDAKMGNCAQPAFSPLHPFRWRLTNVECAQSPGQRKPVLLGQEISRRVDGREVVGLSKMAGGSQETEATSKKKGDIRLIAGRSILLRLLFPSLPCRQILPPSRHTFHVVDQEGRLTLEKSMLCMPADR